MFAQVMAVWLFLLLSHHWDKIPSMHHLKERLILADGFRGFSSQSAGNKAETSQRNSMAEESHSACGSKEERQELETATHPPGHLF